MLEVARVLRSRKVDLTDQERLPCGLPQRGQDADHLGPVSRVDVVELRGLRDERERKGPGGRRIVAQLLVLDHDVEGVHAEAVDPAVEPEAHDALHRRDDLRVAPVEVRLLRVERVQVPAAGFLVAAPRGAAECGRPVVGRPVDRRPDVPVRMLAEPRVLDRRVREDEVEQ